MPRMKGVQVFAIDFEELDRLYVMEFLSINLIARMYNVSYSTILRSLQKYDITRRGRGEAHKGKIVSKETRAKISVGNQGNRKWLGRKHTVEARVKMSNYRRGKTASDETKAKMSETHAMQWQDLSFKDKSIKASRIGMLVHPNKPESMVLDMLNVVAPNEWAFVGDGQLIIAGKNPDFANINGQKKLIEVFGDYWHGERARCYEETEEGRISLFRKYGYETIIVWEHELKETEKLVVKIKNFCMGY